MIDPYHQRLRQSLNQILPSIADRLEDLADQDEALATKIVVEILRAACSATHMGSILSGRLEFRRLPRAWLRPRLYAIILSTLDVDDYWEYLRLLELLSENKLEIFAEFIQMGRASKNAEIQQAATEFLQNL